jgi:hypothetical protein
MRSPQYHEASKTQAIALDDHPLFGDAIDVGRPEAHHAQAVCVMSICPTSSPKMTRMFGFLVWALCGSFK